MPTVVIVHAAEDSAPARALAEKLGAMGLTTVVDKGPGEPLRAAVQTADAVVALWSPRSVGQLGLIDEVASARGAGPVIHVRMQNAASPPEFAGDRDIDLTGWRGEDTFPAWQELAKAVADRAGVTPPAPSASPFFQPGAPPAAPRAQAPPQRQAPPQAARPVAAPRPVAAEPAPRYEAPMRPPEEPSEGGGSRLVMIGIVTFLVVAALGGGGYFAFTQMQGSQASSTAWENIDKTDPAALRAFLADNPGTRREDAQAALASLDEESYAAARSSDSIEAYQGYVSDFPDGENVLAARGRIAELQAAPPSDTAETEIDPLTGMPYAPEDLLPPESLSGDPVEPLAPTPDAGGGGPTPLGPPPVSEDGAGTPADKLTSVSCAGTKIHPEA
ncbi:MAG: TIR domain-containing protein [Terricaulis sp.]